MDSQEIQSVTVAATSTPEDMQPQSSGRQMDGGNSLDTTASFEYNVDPRVKRLLEKGYCGHPISASLSGAPEQPIAVLEEKMQWRHYQSFGWTPKWSTTQPRIEDIGTAVLPFLSFCGIDPEDFEIRSFKEGTYNKLYLISSSHKAPGPVVERIFRVTLPVDSWYKMQSEVATMEFVRERTSTPIPRVYVFESSIDNPVGFEWMIMEKVEGCSVREARERLTQEQTQRVRETTAGWVNQLLKLKFDEIGSLYGEWDPDADGHLEYRLGPCVDVYAGPCPTENNSLRGPFQNEAQYLRSVAQRQMDDVQPNSSEAHSKAPSQGGMGNLQNARRKMSRALDLLDDELSKMKREYFLWHFDIAEQNIMLDDQNEPIALLDWENIITRSQTQVYPSPEWIDLKTLTQGPGSWWELLPFWTCPWVRKSHHPRQGHKINFKNELEEDVAKLAEVVESLHGESGDLGICEEIEERYGGETKLASWWKKLVGFLLGGNA